jgi:hypothetical protein
MEKRMSDRELGNADSFQGAAAPRPTRSLLTGKSFLRSENLIKLQMGCTHCLSLMDKESFSRMECFSNTRIDGPKKKTELLIKSRVVTMKQKIKWV